MESTAGSAERIFYSYFDNFKLFAQFLRPCKIHILIDLQNDLSVTKFKIVLKNNLGKFGGPIMAL